jgi:hypothetical protein
VLFLLSKLLRNFLPATLLSALSSPPRKRRFGWYPTNLRMAFLTLQVMAEPTIGHTIEQHLVQHDEEDDSCGPDDPVAHLLRQARQIRRGNPPERLTARLPQPPQPKPVPYSK